jgi:hypothetical protein
MVAKAIGGQTPGQRIRADVRECGSQNGASAAPEDEPKSPDELRKYQKRHGR